MKTNYIIVAAIIVAFLLGECSTKKSFDYKVTVIPQTYNSIATPGDLNKAAEVINKRLKYFFSIPQERIKLDVTENQISLTISKVDTSKIDMIRNVITDYNKLEFWETYENSELTGYLSKANTMLRDMQTIAAGTAANQELIKQNPLFGILKPMVTDHGEPLPSCLIGIASGTDTSEINKYFKMDQIKAIFPLDIKFYWSAKPYKYDPSETLYGLHAIKVTSINKQAPLDGSVIISAKPTAGAASSGVKIDLTMDSGGAKRWAGITRENLNRCIAVVYDGYVRSYPRVMSEISGVNTEITGDFTIEEANDLVNILKSGELPSGLKIVKEQIVKNE
jgi:SecD/SecF fusion protein